MAIPVLSPELMEKQLLRYEKQLEVTKDAEARTALVGRIKSIELFLDNCVIETLSGVLNELRIDTKLFDIPFLANALGMRTEEIPKQLEFNFKTNKGCMTPEEIEEKKKIDPMFKAIMEKQSYFSIGRTTASASNSVTEAIEGGVKTVTENVTIDFSKPVVKKAIPIIAKKLAEGDFKLEFGKSIARLAEIAGSKEASRSEIFRHLVANLEMDKISGYKTFSDELTEIIKKDGHPIRAFLHAKETISDWSDEDVADFIRYISSEIPDHDEILNRSASYVQGLCKDSSLQELLCKFYETVEKWEKTSESDVKIAKIHPTNDSIGFTIKLQKINDLISPKRSAKLASRKKPYVEKGYPA